MAAWFDHKKHTRRASYVTIREYTYSSLPKPSPKWSRKAKFAFVCVAGLVFVYFLVSGDLGIMRLITLHQLHDELTAEELTLAAQVVDLDTRRRLLEADTMFIEQIARTEYQFSRPGETVYEVVPQARPASASGRRPLSRTPRMAAPDVTEAICLTAQKFSETSKIAVLYTRAWGRISVMAKGAYRPKSQFWGHLESLSISECVVYKKPKEQIYLLSSCRAIVPWVPLTASLAQAGYAFAVAEFLYRFSYEERDPDLYDLSRAALLALAHLPENLLARQYTGYLLGALESMGFRPSLDECTSCGREPEPGQAVVFDAAAGRIICRDCMATRSEGSRPHRLSAPALAELRHRQNQPILELSEPPLANGAENEITAAVEDFARYHLGGSKIRSLDFARRMSAI